MNLFTKWWSWIILVYGGYELIINTGILRKKLQYFSDCGWLTNTDQDNFWPHIKFLDTVSYEEILLNVISEMSILSPWTNSHKLNMQGGLLKSPMNSRPQEAADPQSTWWTGLVEIRWFIFLMFWAYNTINVTILWDYQSELALACYK